VVKAMLAKPEEVAVDPLRLNMLRVLSKEEVQPSIIPLGMKDMALGLLCHVHPPLIQTNYLAKVVV